MASRNTGSIITVWQVAVFPFRSKWAEGYQLGRVQLLVVEIQVLELVVLQAACDAALIIDPLISTKEFISCSISEVFVSCLLI
jgi:hypothetical protein